MSRVGDKCIAQGIFGDDCGHYDVCPTCYLRSKCRMLQRKNSAAQQHEKAKGGCPVTDGELGFDYRMYPECSTCEHQQECEKEHIRHARGFLAGTSGITHITIPLGLLIDDELRPQEALLISFIAFRAQRYDASYDKNKTLARLLHVSEARISQLLGTTHRDSLVNRGYLETERQRLKRKSKNDYAAYRTSRLIWLSQKSVRAINASTEKTDKIQRYEPRFPRRIETK